MGIYVSTFFYTILQGFSMRTIYEGTVTLLSEGTRVN